MTQPVTVSLDLIFFGRILAAFCWGSLFAVFLQHSRVGQWWAEERTWLTVVIGVGVDLAIAFGGEWLTVVTVITVSSLGIIARSLMNEQSGSKSFHRNKVIWNIEDATALTKQLIEIVDGLLDRKGAKDTRDLKLAQLLPTAYQIQEKLKCARRGEYDQTKLI